MQEVLQFQPREAKSFRSFEDNRTGINTWRAEEQEIASHDRNSPASNFISAAEDRKVMPGRIPIWYHDQDRLHENPSDVEVSLR